jgi:hypothetical protein
VTRLKKASFYLITFLGSLGIALVAAELVARQIPLSNGMGLGRAAGRWGKHYWQPINTQGFRDLEWTPPSKPQSLVFLGDSFTEGHGVEFTQTFVYRVRGALEAEYSVYNLGQGGASTRKEIANYGDFRAQTGIKPAVLVHQYYGNDINDIDDGSPEMALSSWEPSRVLRLAADYSDLADLLRVYWVSRHWGPSYVSRLLEGYENTTTIAAHEADLHKLFDVAHSDEARVIFLVFPHIHNEASLRASGVYIALVRRIFDAVCAPGDIFLDASPIVERLRPRQRVVNFLDGHPSRRLHEMVGDELIRLIRTPTATSGSVGGAAPAACNRSP